MRWAIDAPKWSNYSPCAVEVLIADSHDERPSTTGVLLEAALVLGGAEVRRLETNNEPSSASEQRSLLRCVLPNGWQIASRAIELGATELHARPPERLRQSPLFVVGDGPVDAASASAAALGDYPGERVWVNCSPPEDDREPRPLRLLAAVGALALSAAEVELAAPRPYLVAPRRRSGHAAAAIEILAGSFRGWGVRIIASSEPESAINSYSLLELLELPVAMCRTTMSTFLASPAGRALALPLLQEGLTMARRLRRPLAALPVHDPQALMKRWRAQIAQGRKHRAIRGSAQVAEDPLAFAPSRDFNRILRSFLAGQLPLPQSANEYLVQAASRVGSNLVRNVRLVQLARKIPRVGFYDSAAELLEQVG